MADDSDAIAQDYAQSLKELTFNSRPVIDNLTTIARENPNAADGIISAITQRIYKSIPEHKLFALFLLDSVCKYAGNSYNILVGEEIFQLYSHVFQYSNDQMRKTKLISLFETWKVTKTKGSSFPLFPPEQIEKIEMLLTRAGFLKKNIPGGEQLTNNKLIDDINKLLPILQNRLSSGQSNPKLQGRFEALTQLKQALLTQKIGPETLKAFQDQVNVIRDEEGGATIPTPATTPGPSAPSKTPSIPSKPTLSSVPTTPKAAPANNFPQNTPNTPQQDNLSRVEGIFSALITSGLVNVDQAPVPGSKPMYKLVYPQIKYAPITNELPSNSTLQDILNSNSGNSIHKSEYERMRYAELLTISQRFTITETGKPNYQEFISKNKPQDKLVDLLYDAKSSKCTICGKRFSTDLMDANRKRLHLDWHFRINKKLSAGGNVQSRNWYLDDYGWAKFKDEELLEYSVTSTNAQANQTGEVEAVAGPVPYVKVPPSDNNFNNRCLLCRESVKATLNEEIGEWCWYNCVLAPGEANKPNSRKIVHASCKNDNKRTNDGDLNTRIKREKV